MSLFKKLSLLAVGLVLSTSPVLAQSSSESSQSDSSQTSYESLEAASNELTPKLKEALDLKDAKKTLDNLAQLFKWEVTDSKESQLANSDFKYTIHRFGPEAVLLSTPDNKVLAFAMAKLDADTIRQRMAGLGVKPEAQMERLLNREPSPVDKVFVETKDFGLILSGHHLGQDEKKPDKPQYDLFVIYNHDFYKAMVKDFE